MSNEVLTLGERIVMAARLAAIEHVAQELAELNPEPPAGDAPAEDAPAEAALAEEALPLHAGFVARVRGNIARFLHVRSGKEVA